MLRALRKDRQAIRQLYEQHAVTLIELMQSMDESPGKRLALTKTMVYLILKAPEELVTVDSAVFGRFFEMAAQSADDEIIENILWLQEALIEMNSSEEQRNKAIELCTDFRSAHLYAKCLKESESELIVL